MHETEKLDSFAIDLLFKDSSGFSTMFWSDAHSSRPAAKRKMYRASFAIRVSGHLPAGTGKR